MMWDTYLGHNIRQCLFSLVLVHDPVFTYKALLLGEPFFHNYNVSLDFDNHLLGLEGYRHTEMHHPPTPTPVDPVDPIDPEPPAPMPDDDEEEEEEEWEMIDDLEDEEEQGTEHHFIAMVLLVLGLIVGFVVGVVYYLKRRKRQLQE